MNKKLVANASTTIDAPVARVWDALVTPKLVKQYMFGTDVVSDWKKGSPIVWKGEWKGKPYQDKGVIVEIEPERMIRYTHFSPLTGQPDTPENYHTVTIKLSSKGSQTLVALSQDNNADEKAKKHNEENWGTMLASLKKLLQK